MRQPRKSKSTAKKSSPKQSARKKSPKSSAKKSTSANVESLFPGLVNRADWKASFMEAFPHWTKWFEGDEPVYALPPTLVTELAKGHEASRLLKDQQAEEELEFAKLCTSWHQHTVGAWRGAPIRNWPFASVYQLSNNAAAPPKIHVLLDEKRAAAEGIWNIGNPGEAKRLKEEFRHAAVAWMGHCLFDRKTSPVFRRELEGLKAHWQKLPRPLQTPIHRIGKWVEEGKEINDYSVLAGCLDRGAAVSDGTNFKRAYDQLLMQWGLSGFATWELPNIPPPILGLPLFQAAQVLPFDAVINYWPPQIQCPPDVDFRDVLLNQQIQYPQDVESSQQVCEGDGGGSAGLESVEKFPVVRGKRKDGRPSHSETVMLMYIAELALKQRYGDVRGRWTMIGEAFEEWQGLNKGAVKNYRGDYTKFLIDRAVGADD